MKSAIVALALLSSVIGQEQNYRPKGALLVLPQEYNPSARQEESIQELGEKVAERFRQQQGSEEGDYHVYLSDGRLQRVRYTAAPISTQQENTRPAGRQVEAQQEYSRQIGLESGSYQVNRASDGVSEPNPVVAHFGRLQQERIQQQLKQLQEQQDEIRQQEERLQQELKQQKQFASNYVATIQFNDVPPIPAPIYSQSPSPITRILRQAA